MNYDFYLNGEKINDYIIDFEYSEKLENVATSFTMKAIKDFGLTSVVSGDKKLNCLCVYPKDSPIKLIYMGYIITAEHTTDKNKYQYNGYDVGFYLNKNPIVKKVEKNIKIEIKKICEDNQIKLGLNQEFLNSISKIYKGESFADVLKDFLKHEKDNGGLTDIYIDCKDGNLNIRQYQLEGYLSAVIANNIRISADNTFNKVSIKHSIEDLRNKVIAIDHTGCEIALDKPEQNNKSISIYGLLTHAEKIDVNKKNDIQETLFKKLRELNQEKEEISLSLLGDYRVSKGKLIELYIPEYSLNSIYLVTSANHKITRNSEKIDISIKRLNY